MFRCNNCGTLLPAVGKVCPWCGQERDIEAEGRAFAAGFSAAVAGGLAFLLTGGFSGNGDIGTPLGAMVITGVVAAVLGLILPDLMAKLSLIGVLVGLFLFFGGKDTAGPKFQLPGGSAQPSGAGQGNAPPADIKARLQVGMSFDEARGIVGEPPPGKVSRSQDNIGTQYEVWDFPTVKILFKNGRVASVE